MGLVVSMASSVPAQAMGASRVAATAHGNPNYRTVPSVIGVSLCRAVFLLEQHGVSFIVKTPDATGPIYKQSPAAGSRMLCWASMALWARPGKARACSEP